MKKTIKIIFIILSIVVIVFTMVLYGLHKKAERDYQEKGAQLIAKIENFKQIEKRLPNTIEELGIEESMNEGPYYEKKDSVKYVVFFNIGFDNTLIYYSDKKEWKDEKY